MKGIFLNAPRDAGTDDPVKVAMDRVEDILQTQDVEVKMIAWEYLLEYTRRFVIMLPLEVWDNLLADPDIGPTIQNFKMLKGFYKEKASDPFDGANPL